MIRVYKNEEPLISVIICSFNRAELLPRALDSLVLQYEKSWEAIVVDDGSTDNTYNVVMAYCRRFPNFRYMYHSNRKLGFSRNAGILAASGSYVTFLDSDDEYLPGHLSNAREILTANPDIDLLHGCAEIIGNPYVNDALKPGQLIHIDECVIGGTFFIKKAKAIDIGGFPDQNFADDFTFFQKAESSGLRIMKTDKRTYRYYRDTPGAING